MNKKPNILKTIDDFTSNIFKLILLLATLVGHILLNYFVLTNTYGIVKTIFIILILFIAPIIAMYYSTNMKNKKERYFVTSCIKIVWSIVLSVFYINLFKDAIPANITIPVYVILETLSNLCFVFKLNKTNSLIINLKSLFTTTGLLLLAFFLIEIKLCIILLVIIFLPTLIIYFGTSSKK